jgi:hypothetical protein
MIIGTAIRHNVRAKGDPKQNELNILFEMICALFMKRCLSKCLRAGG